MTDDLFPNAEVCARQSARDLITAIVGNTSSPDDVPALLDQLIAWMRDEWASIDWQYYAEEWGIDLFAGCDHALKS